MISCTKQTTPRIKSASFWRLSSAVDYGIIFLTILARNKSVSPISLKEIATAENVSFLFLQKIARLLRRKQLIVSTRGNIGGYNLGRKPHDISVKDIIEAIEGPIAVMPCQLGPTSCHRSKLCKIQNGISQINGKLSEMLLNQKLSSFLK